MSCDMRVHVSTNYRLFKLLEPIVMMIHFFGVICSFGMFVCLKRGKMYNKCVMRHRSIWPGELHFNVILM